MTVLNFYDPNNVEVASRQASQILAACNGKTYEEVLDRLSAPLTPKQILSKIEAEYCALDDIPYDAVVEYFNVEPKSSV